MCRTLSPNSTSTTGSNWCVMRSTKGWTTEPTGLDRNDPSEGILSITNERPTTVNRVFFRIVPHGFGLLSPGTLWSRPYGVLRHEIPQRRGEVACESGYGPGPWTGR